MSRRDNVLSALLALSNERPDIAGTLKTLGFTTAEIARRAGILRNNCSAELNALVREGVVTKVNGRPAFYRLMENSFPSDMTANSQTNRPEMDESMHNDSDMVQRKRSPWFVENRGMDIVHLQRQGAAYFAPDTASRGGSVDVFDWGVASEQSLREAVQQAEIAVSYPPNGMHVLLLGETGVGKSTFARRMHEYAVTHGILRKNAPFIGFNCSDYANNPEMLLGQLFGHVRGAYTGAHTDKRGLVEQAHEGMLFLDEVHRLPPQGQEMLFHLLDYGQFRRLGETQAAGHARILLVAATTEAPESALLSTFRRRIPVVIRLPVLRDWTLHDRHQLIYSLCREEARTLGIPICITSTALDVLLFSRFSANIGDLKNTLKLACARAFTNRDSAMIRVFSEHVIVPPADGPNPIFLRRFSPSSHLVVFPDSQASPPSLELDTGGRFASLHRLSQSLQELGFATEEIMDALERELDKQDREGQESPPSQADLRQFVGDAFYSAMSRAWAEIENDKFATGDEQESAFLRVSMHLFGVIREGRHQSEPTALGLPDLIQRVQTDSPELYRTADELLSAFTRHSGVPLSIHERAIVAMLIRPREVERRRAPGVVVALFGFAIAKHMVDAALRATGHGSVMAVDIPFQTPVHEMDARLTEAVIRASQGRGVLVFTDVPRFYGEEWQPPAGIAVAYVHHPDLHTVIRGLQAVENGRTNLAEIGTWLNTRRPNFPIMALNKKLIVWACCLTGKGTARAVERLLQEALPPDLRGRVEIVPKEISPTPQPAQPEEGLVAAVGSINPAIFGVPFFSVEALLTREGIDQLLNVLYLGDAAAGLEHVVQGDAPLALATAADSPAGLDSDPAAANGNAQDLNSVERMEAHIRKLLQRDLVYVNPDLAMKVSKEMWDRIQSSPIYLARGTTPRRETYIRFCLHMAYIIERLVRKEGLVHPYAETLMERFPELWSMMVEAWHPVEAVFRLPVHEHELGYLFEIVFSDVDIEVFE